ncbi:30S ribosome-binding factor RbfA [Oceanispirochaeta crateris]|uniref:Ribosome-binding factor A n=1 Tax=Oceanispirochaeta crateris TaxID=2518645 RepID=A0A5C1QJ59_9SPIO|nr:30S ribosome-binding factor RbfA [Oceanispirochaeta crateris]QEN07651.1 30S ribosome-binding factor RbfA [Oceanispirochaeta crateris]
MKRVESLIREQVSFLIMNREIKDPRINSLLSITIVKVSNDLASAKLYVSGLEGEAKLKKSVDAMNHAAGFIQNRIGRQMKMRLTPKLHFYPDTSVRDGIMLNQKIDSLLHDKSKESES